uniref:F-box domain-containing protein n=1 Tax=Kalanchoe fedtschenkoi TaxID=63787 RepID=A0A7N0TF79_KALFE
METRSSKRRNLLLKEAKREVWGGYSNPDDDVDRISDLPDELLHQILLLLPIKCVAQGSVLSKRWRSLWNSLPDLDFTSLLLPNKARTRSSSLSSEVSKSWPFIDEMDPISNVLARREKSCMLRRLRFCARLSFTRLNGLIRSAIRNNVQELDIEVTTDDHFNLPRCILTSESLKVFKLKSCYPGFHLPPSSILTDGFRSLRLLSLSLIVFRKHFSLHDLFTDTSFPLLNKLSLDTCFGLEHVRFSCPSLRELALQKCFDLRSLEIASAKLETLRVKSCLDANFEIESQVYINGPKLHNIEWEDNAIASAVTFENLDALHQASIGFYVADEGMPASEISHVSKLLAGVSHVSCLVLDCKCVEVNKNLANHPFHNVKSLELGIGFTKRDLKGLSYILSKAPSVQNLTLQVEENKAQSRELWGPARDPIYWENQAQLFKPFLKHVKFVKINGFVESEVEICFVILLIKHAQNLQKLVLRSGYYNPRDLQLREKSRKHLKDLFTHVSSSPPQIVFE